MVLLAPPLARSSDSSSSHRTYIAVERRVPTKERPECIANDTRTLFHLSEPRGEICIGCRGSSVPSILPCKVRLIRRAHWFFRKQPISNCQTCWRGFIPPRDPKKERRKAPHATAYIIAVKDLCKRHHCLSVGAGTGITERGAKR